MGVKETRIDGSVVFVALRYDPFVARRRLFLVDARTTTLLYADERNQSRPWWRRGGLSAAIATCSDKNTRLFDLRSDEITR